jgi:hypothetical protein
MEFYSLIKKESGCLLADIVEFENLSVAVYWHCYDIPRVVVYPSISIIKQFYLDGTRELIKEGVDEVGDSKDILYSA